MIEQYILDQNILKTVLKLCLSHQTRHLYILSRRERLVLIIWKTFDLANFCRTVHFTQGHSCLVLMIKYCTKFSKSSSTEGKVRMSVEDYENTSIYPKNGIIYSLNNDYARVYKFFFSFISFFIDFNYFVPFSSGEGEVSMSTADS